MGRRAWIGLVLVVLGVPSVALGAKMTAPDPAVIIVDIGSQSDASFVKEGLSGREGYNPESKHQYFRTCSFRWAGNNFTVKLPVWPDQDNEVTLRASMGQRRIKFLVNGWSTVVRGEGEPYEVQFTLPKNVVGNRKFVTLRAEALDPYVRPSDARDTRDLTAAIDWFRVKATKPVDVKQVDVGAPGDEGAVLRGFYHREGPYPEARMSFPRDCTFRWATNEFAMRLPVYPNKRNAIILRMCVPGRILRFSIGNWSQKVYTFGLVDPEYKLIVPEEVIGDTSEIVLQCTALTPVKPNPKSPDARLLMALVDWVRIRPAREDEKMPQMKPFAKLQLSVPVTQRLRGVEARPVKADLAAYMMPMIEGGVTAATIGPLNGHVKANYPSKYAAHSPSMDPNWIPNVIAALHQAGIAAVAWVPFNAQDLRKVEDYEPIKKFPQWAMKFIPGHVDSDRPRVGMCVISSPYREHHAKVLTEVAEFDLDEIWFDGFYLGGIPHPTAPGCVCQFCAKKFKQETGLELPEQVDWTDMTFKRWVRWRNYKLIETACYFRDAIRKVKPNMPVAMNTNQWPFGFKDWDNAIPLWRMTEFGVSQHAYSMKPELEWLMLGYKCRLSKDMNPNHCDVWRPASAKYARGDLERHERAMRLFMLSALSYGVIPWHGGHIPRFAAEVRIHHEIADREPYFVREEIQHTGVWISQNTHDFYGHIPDTDHLIDYRDTVLGNWLMLTNNHVPFQFVFDNMVEKGELDGFKVLIAPNVAAMSAKAAEQITSWVRDGGRLIVTAETSAYDEWGEELRTPRLASLLTDSADVLPPSAISRTIGKGAIHYLARDPGLAYVRERDEDGVQALMAALRETPIPIEFKAPPSLIANTFFSPDKKALYVHLLNVSLYMPNEDTGFRGCEQPPKFVADMASDAQIAMSDKPIEGEHRLAKDIVVRPRAWDVKSARLAIAKRDLPLNEDGSITVPEIDYHDVLVFTFR